MFTSLSVCYLVLALFSHFVFDFMAQSDKIACNKSKNFKVLCLHCFIYTIGFVWLWMPFNNLIMMASGLFVLFLSHLVIDFISSRITSYFWLNNDRHNFFVTIGFDQFLHVCVIIYVLMFFVVS